MKQNLFLDIAEELIKEKDSLISKKKRKNIKINHFVVDDNNHNIFKKNKGDYYTIVYDNKILNKHRSNISKEVVQVLKSMFRKYNKSGKTLIIGLGNSDIISDALGPKTTNKVIATNHFNDFLTIPKVALFVPEVIGKTGISSYKLIKMVVKTIKPDNIIIIDSLSTKNHQRLNNCIEISDTGIIPGSAIYSNREISAKTFGIPVIAIGVPLMIKIDNNLYTTPDIENILELTSDILANALNTIFLT